MRLVLTFVLVSLIAAAAYWLVDEGWVRFNYPSERDFPVRGIDVSHHQGMVDWAKVATAGHAFVFLKATEGGDFVDPAFARNWADVRAAGLVRGAYHFLTFCRPVADQLKHLVATVPAEKGTLPPTLDLEFGGNCAKVPAREAMLADLNFMVKGIEAHYGKRPIFYMTAEFLAAFYGNGTGFPVTPVWIRNVFATPTLPSGMKWDFWQYANRGRVEGIQGAVDLNVFGGRLEDFRAGLL